MVGAVVGVGRKDAASFARTDKSGEAPGAGAGRVEYESDGRAAQPAVVAGRSREVGCRAQVLRTMVERNMAAVGDACELSSRWLLLGRCVDVALFLCCRVLSSQSVGLGLLGHGWWFHERKASWPIEIHPCRINFGGAVTFVGCPKFCSLTCRPLPKHSFTMVSISIQAVNALTFDAGESCKRPFHIIV